MDYKKKYYAFISYKREDEQWAKWLQQKLEHYKLPVNLNGRSDLPKEIRPVFKDTSELNPGNLPQQLHSALEQSRYLIVICSPRSAKSEWVNRELETFVEMGRTDKIIPFIIEGKPFSKSPEEECFPEAIRNLPAEQEILGANINEMGRDAAAVKVVSRMFGLKFDELWNRYEREQKRRRRFIVAGISALALLAFGVAAWIWHQNLEIKAKDWKMMESQSRLVAEKVLSDAEDDSYLARRIALEILPKDLSHPDRPYTPEAERALREANLHQTAIIRENNRPGRAVFNPDGKEIMTSFYEESVLKFYDRTGEETRSFKTDYHGYDYSYSPDGKQILSCCDSALFILDSQKGNMTKTLVVDTFQINSARYNHDGKRVITTSGHTIKIWDTETGMIIKTIESEKFYEFAEYSSDGKLIAACERQNEDWEWEGENKLIVFDAETYKEKRRLTIVGDVTSVDISPNGEKILASSYDKIRIWNIENGNLLVDISTDHCWNAAFSFDGEKILSSSNFTFSISSENNPKTIKIWDANSGNELQTLYGHKDVIISAVFSFDGSEVLSASNDKTVRIWSLNSNDNSKILVKNDARLFGSVIEPNNKLIAARCEDSTVRVWDMESGKEKFRLKSDNEIGSVAINPNGKQIAYVSEHFPNLGETRWADSLIFTMSLNFYDIEKGIITKSITDTIDGFSDIAYSPDGRKMVFITYHDKIKMLDLETDSIVWTIEGEETGGRVRFSSDGKKVLYVGYSSCVIDALTGEKQFVKHGSNHVLNAQFSPDGKCFATTAMGNNMVKIWDAEKGNCIKTIEGHENGVLCVCFSPDGKYVASGSQDKTIRVWELQSGVCVCTYKGHDASITNVSFTSDGKQIVSVSDDYAIDDWTIRIWSFPSLQDLIDRTRERFKDRPLTDAERHQYYLE